MVLSLIVVAVDVELHELCEVDVWLVLGEGLAAEVEAMEVLKV
jgi:hypothetical protein